MYKMPSGNTRSSQDNITMTTKAAPLITTHIISRTIKTTAMVDIKHYIMCVDSSNEYFLLSNYFACGYIVTMFIFIVETIHAI